MDAEHGIEIWNSRLGPGRTPDENEHQFAIYMANVRHAFACYGLFIRIERDDQALDVFTLDLGERGASDSLKQLKIDLGVGGSDFEFVQDIAKGLVGVYLTRTDNRHPVRYVAMASHNSLDALGMPSSSELPALPNGDLILSEVNLPHHPASSHTSSV